MSARQTRSQTKSQTREGSSSATAGPQDFEGTATIPEPKRAITAVPRTDISLNQVVSVLPEKLSRSITELRAKDQKILMRKQAWLKDYSLAVPSYFTKHGSVIDATLVFAQQEAGTAVCISPAGTLLTCSHCVAKNSDELDESRIHWLLFRSGSAVRATCVAWDPKRDLALLQVVAAQPMNGAVDGATPFPSIAVAPASPILNSQLVCVGHPGSEDLEVSQPGVRTNYDVLHVSSGRFRGCAEGQDPQDNSGIGALMHDCWTYWGHSGAPLISSQTGELVGLHSSWDDETGMRRGVPLAAIKEFLEENKHCLVSN